jgi:hypothetical protein
MMTAWTWWAWDRPVPHVSGAAALLRRRWRWKARQQPVPGRAPLAPVTAVQWPIAVHPCPPPVVPVGNTAPCTKTIRIRLQSAQRDHYPLHEGRVPRPRRPSAPSPRTATGTPASRSALAGSSTASRPARSVAQESSVLPARHPQSCRSSQQLRQRVTPPGGSLRRPPFCACCATMTKWPGGLRVRAMTWEMALVGGLVTRSPTARPWARPGSCRPDRAAR